MKKKIPVFSIEINKPWKKIYKWMSWYFLDGQGGFVDKFENEFSKYVDCKYGITTTSGTTALHLQLLYVE